MEKFSHRHCGGTVYREIFAALNFQETNFCEINFREWPMRPMWPLPVGGISRNLISRESKNREIRENIAPRKFPGIRYAIIML